jgi:hypothetical protein
MIFLVVLVMDTFNNLITDFALILIKLIKVLDCNTFQIALSHSQLIEQLVNYFMILKNISVLLSDELFELINLFFELVILLNISFDGAGKDKDFEVALTLDKFIEEMNDSETFIIDESLLFVLEDGFVFVNTDISTRDDTNDKV